LGQDWDKFCGYFMPRKSKQPTRKAKEWPQVYPRFNAKGQITSYRVDCGGKDRLRFSFKTKTEASGKAELLRIQRKNEGNAILDFSAAERIDAQAALELLRPHGATLREAAQFYVRNVATIAVAKTAAEASDELLILKEKDEASLRYRKDLRLKLKAFAKYFGERPLHEITRSELVSWLYGLKVSALTRKNYSRALSVLFSFALGHHYVVTHPASDLVPDKKKGRKPGILTVIEAKALLLAAEPDFVPALSLGLFAGLRPESEIWRLDWTNIKLAKRLIDIDQSKNTMSHRHVRITDNLAAWLAPYARANGPVTFKGDSYYARLERARQGAIERLERAKEFSGNLHNWPQDCLRHTFASMHCAAFRNPGDTSLELGHGGSLKVFERHYRDRVEEHQARAFWEIYPFQKIVALPASSA
jgi:site-specific recombinase XerD